MRCLVGPVCLLLLLPLAPAFPQDAPEPGGAWLRFDPQEEYHGLSYVSDPQREAQVRYLEIEGRWCLATEQEAGQYYIDFETEPEFIIPGLDIISVTLEYLDNGTGPIVLQYWSEDYVSSPQGWHYIAPTEVQRRNTLQWKRHTWQIRDSAFGFPNPAGLRFRLYVEGWVPDRDVYASFIGVDHSCLWLEADPRVLGVDGAPTSAVTLTARDAAGSPLPDGTEVPLHAVRGSAPKTVTLAGGQAQFAFAAANRPGTAQVLAVSGERVERCPIFLLRGEGPGEPQARRLSPAAIAEMLEVSGECVAGSSVELVEGPEPYAEVRVQFKPDHQGERIVDMPCALMLDGVPTRLALEIGGDGSAYFFTTQLRDAHGEPFTYTFWTIATGPIRDWQFLELAAEGRAYAGGRVEDGIIDLPARFSLFKVWFDPDCREGVFRIRSLEADVHAPPLPQ